MATTPNSPNASPDPNAPPPEGEEEDKKPKVEHPWVEIHIEAPENDTKYWSDPEATKEFEEKNEFVQEFQLWDAREIAWFSLLLTPVFGFYYQMKNWQMIENKEQIKLSQLWLKISLGYVALSLLLALVLPTQMGLAVIKVMFLMYIFVWYFSNAKTQIEYIKKNIPPNYKRHLWGIWVYPAMAGVAAFIVLSILFSFFN